jgi:polyisoprenoid-binding protein YceI
MTLCLEILTCLIPQNCEEYLDHTKQNREKIVQTKSFIILISGLIASSAAFGAKYNIDAAHSEVGFQVTHLMISKVKGRFTKFEGNFEFDEKKSELKGIDVKVEVPSVSTDNAKRDEHLNSDDFFASKKFPQMSYKGDKVEFKAGKPVKILGSLTMHGVTKPVALEVEYKGTITDPWGMERVGFSASAKINRKDFGLNFDKKMDKGGLVVGEEVTITIDGEAVKAK